MHKTFEQINQNLIESLHTVGADKKFSRGEFSRDTFATFRSELINKLAGYDVGYIIPKLTYDLLIRTDKSSSQQCAQQILNFCNS